MVKTKIEIDHLKIANEIATFGLELASNVIADGTKEIQVATSIENEFSPRESDTEALIELEGLLL